MKHNLAYRADILSFLELDILCNRLGMASIYGLSMVVQEKLSMEQVYSALASLVKKKVMVSNGDEFILQPPWKRRLLCMNEPDAILHIYFYRPVADEMVCYIREDEVCAVYGSQRRNGRLSILNLQLDQFLNEYLADFLPEEYEEADLTSQQYAEYENALLEELEMRFVRQEVYMQCFSPSDEQKNLYLLDNMLSEPYLLVTDGEKRQRMPFTMSRLRDNICQIMGGQYDFG